MNHDQEIKEAELQIAKILEKLEKTCGTLVESISISSIDVTGMNDVRAQHQQKVDIQMVRLPGHQWQ